MKLTKWENNEDQALEEIKDAHKEICIDTYTKLFAELQVREVPPIMQSLILSKTIEMFTNSHTEAVKDILKAIQQGVEPNPNMTKKNKNKYTKNLDELTRLLKIESEIENEK